METPSSSNIARSSSPDLRAGVRRIGQSAADAAKRLMGSGQRPRTGGDTVKIEEDLNMDTLLQLKMAFDKADRDRGGGLDIEEFKQAFLDW